MGNGLEGDKRKMLKIEFAKGDQCMKKFSIF